MTTCRWDRDAADYLIDGQPCAICEGVEARLTANSGYGVLSIHNRQFRAHRVAYQLAIGEIPRGLVIDHLCRNRRCVNPDHLEAVEAAVNTQRGVSPWAVNARRTQCKNGHLFTPENTRYDRGKRCCVECKRRAGREAARRRRARERAAS